MKNCKNCNKEFEPKSKKAEFCSPKCRVYFGRSNKAKIEVYEKKDGEFVCTDQKFIIEDNVNVYGKPGVPADLEKNAPEIVQEIEAMLSSDAKKYQTIQSRDEKGKLMIKTNDPNMIMAMNTLCKKDLFDAPKNKNLNDELRFAKPKKWVKEIEDICNQEGITPDELVKQWKEMKENSKKNKENIKKLAVLAKIDTDERISNTSSLSKWQLELRKKKLGI